MQLKQFETDKVAEAEGIQVPLGDGAWIKIARMGNPNMVRYVRKATAPWGGRQDRIPAEERERIMLDALVETVVLDWGGIFEGPDEVPFSRDNVKRVLRSYPDFLVRVSELASNYETFRRESMEEDQGN